NWWRHARRQPVLAVAQVCVGHDAIKEQHERRSTRLSVVKRANENRARHTRVQQGCLQTLSQQLSHAQNGVGFHAAALLLCSRSISMGGIPNFANSAVAACTMCSKPICVP